jgi:hypothetical protein
VPVKRSARVKEHFDQSMDAPPQVGASPAADREVTVGAARQSQRSRRCF